MNDNKSSQVENRDYWKAEEEKIIQQWADKAQCYQWMHTRCREIYQRKNAFFTIPVIIISTITGTANFAQDRYPEEYKQYIVMGIGTLSIIAGIITTIYQFLQISELNEGYRAAALSWTKFHNTLKTLILRHPLDREPPSYSIKLYKDEYDRLCEISPPIIKRVLKEFNSKFKKNKDLIRPEICSKLEATEVFKMTDEERQNMIKKVNNNEENEKMMQTFFSINGRNPSQEEIQTLQENIHFEENSENIDEFNNITHI